jgi:hypothetical protein
MTSQELHFFLKLTREFLNGATFADKHLAADLKAALIYDTNN